MNNPKLILESQDYDGMDIEIGMEGDDYAVAKHTVLVSIKDDDVKVGRAGKVNNSELEAFAIQILQALGYSIK